MCSFISCAKFRTIESTPKEYIVFPAPPDTARIQFLTTINSSLDVAGNQSAFNKFVFGEAKPSVLVKPYGVDIRNGKMYICDIGLGGIVIIDFIEHSFEQFIPSGRGSLKLPLSCFVDKKGYLFVADGNRKQIVVFDDNGKFVHAFGEKENFKPTDVFVRDDKIWVTNVKNHKVNVYKNDSTYEFLSYFPKLANNEEGFLNQPTNISVTSDKVYVTDFGAFKIKIYNHDGTYSGAIGSYGKGFGQFVRPKGIALDKEDNLFVVDAAFENVQIFNKNKQLLMFFGGPIIGGGGMSLPAKIDIDYENIRFFEEYVAPEYTIKYLILVTNIYGNDKLNIYAYVEPKK